MFESQQQAAVSHEEILDRLAKILADLTSEWDSGIDESFGPDVKLVADLEFESIDVVQLVVDIEEAFGRRRLPFEEILMVDGRYVDDIRVGDVVDFLHHHLNAN